MRLYIEKKWKKEEQREAICELIIYGIGIAIMTFMLVILVINW